MSIPTRYENGEQGHRAGGSQSFSPGVAAAETELLMRFLGVYLVSVSVGHKVDLGRMERTNRNALGTNIHAHWRALY